MFELHKSLSAPSHEGVCARVQFGIVGGLSRCEMESSVGRRCDLGWWVSVRSSALVRRSFSTHQYWAFDQPHAHYFSHSINSETQSQTAHERYSRFVVDAEVGGGDYSSARIHRYFGKSGNSAHQIL